MTKQPSPIEISIDKTLSIISHSPLIASKAVELLNCCLSAVSAFQAQISRAISLVRKGTFRSLAVKESLPLWESALISRRSYGD